MAKKQIKKNQNQIGKELDINHELYSGYNIPCISKIGLSICKACFNYDLYVEMHYVLSELQDDNSIVNFYISKDENISLENLFQEFNFPSNLWSTLKLAWLNVVFVLLITASENIKTRV